jgi:hypothetical protein
MGCEGDSMTMLAMITSAGGVAGGRFFISPLVINQAIPA